MRKQPGLSFATVILLVLLTSCEPNLALAPGVDLSGKSLRGRDLRGVDLSGANLSGTDLSDATMGLGGAVKPEKVFEGVTCAQWLKNSNLLALCDKESVKIWDADSDTFVQTVVLPDGQDTKVWAVSPNGTMLLLETRDSRRIRHLSLWDTKTNTSYPLDVDAFQAGYPSWSPDGSYLVMSVPEGGKRRTWMWDVARNTLVDTIRNTLPNNRSWSNDGRVLVYDGLPDTDENPNTHPLEFWNVPANNRDRTFPAHLRVADNIDWSPDDRLIVVSESLVPVGNPLGEILEVESGAHVRYLEDLAKDCDNCESVSIGSIAWSPDRPMIAGGTSEGTIVIWDAATGSILCKFNAGDGNVTSLQWSEDGQHLLSNDSNLWDVTKILGAATLAGANLTNANLSGANLAGLDLTTVTLTGAKLSGANLRGANLSGMDLRTVSLDKANLSGANLTNSDLSGVNLSGAIVAQTNFDNTNLTGADLRGVRPIEYLLKSVCHGIGMAQMPSYVDQPGIHPLLVLDYDGRKHQWNSEVYDKWRPTNEHLPEIIACIGEFTDTTLGYCHYVGAGGSSTASRLQTSVDVTLREAHSGSIIASTTFHGPVVTSCPRTIMEGETSIGGKHPQFSDTESWFSEYVEK